MKASFRKVQLLACMHAFWGSDLLELVLFSEIDLTKKFEIALG